MGTRNLNVMQPAELANQCPKSVADAHAEYKQFRALKKKDELDSNQEAGSLAYLVSVKWLKRYHKYILYEQFQYGYNESRINITEEHWTKDHPGPITNADFLEEDKGNQNLFGTGTDEDLPTEYIDQYVESNAHQQYDFMIFNPELWEFLFKRYGGNPVKRYYTRSSAMYYTSVEAKLTAVSVQFINSKKLLHGAFNPNMLKQWWTQVSKNASLKDVKKRVAEHINAAGLKVSLDDTRLWLYNTAQNDPEMQLENRCKQVRDSYAKQGKTGND